MLKHPTFDQLNAMGLYGMAKAFNDLAANAESDSLRHADWLALLLDREAAHRQDKRLGARLRYARLRHNAAPEDIDYRAPRGPAARGYAPPGSRTMNRAPVTLPSASRMFSALIRPCRPSTICRLIDRPRPECWPKRSPLGRSE